MNLSQVHYLPLAPPFFLILVGLFVILLVLIQLGALRYAYMRLGISSGAALFLLFASLIGSYFNIPVVYLPEQRVLAQQEIDARCVTSSRGTMNFSKRLLGRPGMSSLLVLTSTVFLSFVYPALFVLSCSSPWEIYF